MLEGKGLYPDPSYCHVSCYALHSTAQQSDLYKVNVGLLCISIGLISVHIISLQLHSLLVPSQEHVYTRVLASSFVTAQGLYALLSLGLFQGASSMHVYCYPYAPYLAQDDCRIDSVVKTAAG